MKLVTEIITEITKKNMKENMFDRDHDPNGDGGPGILISIALLWLVLSIVGVVVAAIWLIVT